MLFRGFVLIFFVMFSSRQVFSAGHCIMRGFCGENDFGKATCSYNGTAVPLEDEDAVKTLKEICPDVIRETNLLCCDAEQVEELKDNLDIVTSLLGKCPSCLSNFRKLVCQAVCSPRQSDFMKVTGLAFSDEDELVVDRISHFVSHSFANGMFDSCKGIQGLTPDSTILDLMCGNWGKDCNAERWLNFIGSTPDNNGFSPFEMNYHLTSEGYIVVDGKCFIPMNRNITLCSESPYPGAEACTCLDCEAAC